MLFYNVDRFLNFSTPGYNVFRHQEAFTGFDCKPPAKNEFTIFLFGEDVPFPEVAGNFLAHDNSAQGRRHDRITLDIPKLSGQFATDLRG